MELPKDGLYHLGADAKIRGELWLKGMPIYVHSLGGLTEDHLVQVCASSSPPNPLTPSVRSKRSLLNIPPHDPGTIYLSDPDSHEVRGTDGLLEVMESPQQGPAFALEGAEYAKSEIGQTVRGKHDDGPEVRQMIRSFLEKNPSVYVRYRFQGGIVECWAQGHWVPRDTVLFKLDIPGEPEAA